MIKVDLKKELKHLYHPSAKEISVIDVPNMNFLMIDGYGNPNTSPLYAESLEALYALAYTLKFAIKKSSDIDYPVMPLEGLWWAEDMETFLTREKETWQWRMMIMQPPYVTADLFQRAVTEVAKKKSLSRLHQVHLAAYHEGAAAQILYIGSYDAETATIARLHKFIAEKGGVLHGKHHEIYLGDPRKTAPEKLKTVIRQPMSLPSGGD